MTTASNSPVLADQLEAVDHVDEVGTVCQDKTACPSVPVAIGCQTKAEATGIVDAIVTDTVKQPENEVNHRPTAPTEYPPSVEPIPDTEPVPDTEPIPVDELATSADARPAEEADAVDQVGENCVEGAPGSPGDGDADQKRHREEPDGGVADGGANKLRRMKTGVSAI